MKTITALMQRELGAYLLSPIAYVAATIFLFVSGLVFALTTFVPGGEASLRNLMDGWMVLFVGLLLPMLTMRLISDELRSGTIETLMTAPVSDVQVIVGKFLGAYGFYLILLASVAIYPILIAVYAEIDVKLLLCHLLGLLLLGGLFIAVGIFFSALTKHQVIAVILTVAVLLLFTLAADGLARNVEGTPRALLQHASIISHYRDFVRGRVELSHLIFFVTTTGLFLFLTVKSLEMRRWR